MAARGAFSDGWGLPLALFGFSFIVSVTALAGFAISAETGPPSLKWLHYVFGVGCFMAQWLANCAVLRAARRRDCRGRALAMFVACAAMVGGGLHHAIGTMRDAGWRAQVEQRVAGRVADEGLMETSRKAVQEARARLVSLPSDIPRTRLEALQDSLEGIVATANLEAEAARTRLARIPPLSPQRTRDAWDLASLAAGLAAALIELLGYSILERRETAPVSSPSLQVANDRKRSGFLRWAAAFLFGISPLGAAPAMADASHVSQSASDATQSLSRAERDAKILELRREYEPPEIAAMFGVHVSTVYRVLQKAA